MYDIAGRQVAVLAEQRMEAGTRTRAFDGAGLASGIYFAHLSAGVFHASTKLVLLK